MIRALHMGFGVSIAHELPAPVAFGVQGVRLDCQRLGAARTAELAAEAAAHPGLHALVIVYDADDARALLPSSYLHLEFRNEPDLSGVSARDYRTAMLRCYDVVSSRGLRMFGGCISNLNARGLSYLRALDVATWPADMGVSVHRYPHGDGPTVPHPGFGSREAEVVTLKSIIGSRPWVVSEFGYHTANRATSWWDRVTGRSRCWTAQQQADYAGFEWRFWERAGAVGAVLYQHIDGPTSTRDCRGRQALDCYGIRDVAGRWKPVSATFREA